MINAKNFIQLLEVEFDDLKPGSLIETSIYKEVMPWNSINSVVVSVVIEAEYGVLLETEDFSTTETIQELIDLVTEKMTDSSETGD